ncbi:MAG: acyltransferase family protein [Chitinophagaceae bacterium]|nr:acyltransferase family protein [Chitinophagaceae bacterium]
MARVDLFFVLSGYLNHKHSYISLGHKNYLKNFYVRRLLRIFPLYYLFLILSLFLIPFVSSLDVSYYKQNQAWMWSYLQNWLFIVKEPWVIKLPCIRGLLQ